MSSKLKSVIDRVEKLLRLAARSNQPGEVAAAQAMAQQLITKYQIEEAQLNDRVVSGDVISKIIDTPAPYALEKSMLLNSIAKYNFCKVLRTEDRAIIYGFPSDVELCLALYSVLSVHMAAEAVTKLAYAKASSDTKIHSRSWTKSFFGGYSNEIAKRLEQSKNYTIKEVEDTGKSLAVAIRNKQHAVEEFFQNIERTPSRDVKLSSAAGYNAGKDSAQSAYLNQTSIES